jgi:hypothetical protein
MTAMQELQGARHFRLGMLDDCSDACLATVVPTWRRQEKIAMLGNRFVQSSAGEGESIVHFEFTGDDMRLLALFDGKRSLGRISRDWSVRSGLSEAAAFARVRAFWLPLAKAGILVPQPSFVPDLDR